jgi:flagellar biosynthesis protein FlhB
LAEESDLEKTEDPSQRRLEQAREEGLVPQSRELSTFLVVMAAVAGVWVMGQWVAQRLLAVMREGLAIDRGTAFDGAAMLAHFANLAVEALLTLLPLFLVVLVAALAAPILLGGVVFAPRLMTADFSRMDPIQGMGRMFSLHGLAELLRSILKPLLVVGIGAWAVWQDQERLMQLMLSPLQAGVPEFGATLLHAALLILAGLALLALIDVPFQLWQYYARLRMSREELMQEAREQEGDPRIKARIRARQRARARQRRSAPPAAP